MKNQKEQKTQCKTKAVRSQRIAWMLRNEGFPVINIRPKDAYAEINQIIADTGLKVSDQFKSNIKDSNLKNEQTDKKKADKAVTGIKDTKVSGSTGTGSTSADKVIRNAATDAQDKTLKKLSLSPKSVVVNVGKTATVKVSFSPASAVNKNFTCTASAKGIVKITQTADRITLKGLKTGKTVIKVQGAGGYCKAVHLIMLCRKESRSSSARSHTRHTGLCLIKVICSLHMAVRSK